MLPEGRATSHCFDKVKISTVILSSQDGCLIAVDDIMVWILTHKISDKYWPPGEDFNQT